MGAVAAGGMALTADATSTGWMVPAVLLAGVIGGMFWAGIVAFLRDRFNANEILVSLMLVYVAIQLLQYVVYGPWKDPNGYNFPQTKTFDAVTKVPRLLDGSRVTIGLLLALIGAGAVWVYLYRTRAGFAQQVGVERMILLLQEMQQEPAGLGQQADVYLAHMGDAASMRTMQLAEQLRTDIPGLRVLWHCGGGSLKNQMKKADQPVQATIFEFHDTWQHRRVSTVGTWSL